MKSIVVRRLRTGSIYRLIATGAAFGFVPLFVVLGLLASAQLFTLNWNGQAVAGPKALLVGPLMGIFFAVIGVAVFGSAIALGLWIYSKFKPLTIEYEEASSQGDWE